MDTSQHTLPNLFKQLGLPDDAVSIEQFIASHSPLDPSLHLADAFFWTPAQKALLRDEILEDADWAMVVDELSVLLHQQR